MSTVFRYYIEVVESEGGADFSFPYVSDRELVPNDVVEDELGRVFVPSPRPRPTRPTTTFDSGLRKPGPPSNLRSSASASSRKTTPARCRYVFVVDMLRCP